MDFSSTRVFPNVSFDRESNKENPTAKTSAVEEHIHSEAIIDNKTNMDEREIDKVADIPIQDAFIFCPMTGTFVLNETLDQGIFASETEMNQTEANKNSIVNRFITINFEEKDANRSKMQAIKEYIKDVKENAKEYNAELYVAGIFSFEEESPIENWLYTSIDSLLKKMYNRATNKLDGHFTTH